MEALTVADVRGQRSVVEEPGGPEAANLVPLSGPGMERGATERRPEAAGAGTAAASVPNRDSQPTAEDGRPARPVKASRARQPPALSLPATRIREPLRPLQLPSSSMAAFAASPAPLPLPPGGFTGPGAFGALPGAQPSDGKQAAVQGQAAHEPGASQAAALLEEAVRFRPDWTSIGQAGRQETPQLC